jgi:hypothetical protein
MNAEKPNAQGPAPRLIFEGSAEETAAIDAGARAAPSG